MRSLRVLGAIAVVMATAALYVIPATTSAGASGTYSCPGGWSLSGSSCTRVTTDTPHKRLWISATYTPAATTTTSSGSTPPATSTSTGTTSCPTGETLSLGTCQTPAITQTGTTFSYSNTFYCPARSFFPGQSAVYSANATTNSAAKTMVDNDGNAWIALFCFNYQANATATATSANGTVCNGAASETSLVSYAAALAAAKAAAQTMADVACSVTPGSGGYSAIEYRSFSGVVTVPYMGCSSGVLTSEPFTQTGTSPTKRGFAYGTTQLQANSNAAAAAIAKGLANVTATVTKAAPTSYTTATCSNTTTTTTPPTTTVAPTPTTTVAPTPTPTTTTPTSTVTAVQNIWLPIVALVNSAHAVVISHQTIRVLLVPLTQVALTTPTLETTDPTTGATTTGCTPTENAQGSYTLPNCSIVGGVGDSVLFNFQSDTGLAVNSASFTIPATTSSSSASYTCPSGGHLDATDTSCATTSTTAASYVRTGSTPIYNNVRTGSTPIYTYELTGYSPTYSNVRTGTGYTYTYEVTGYTPTYGYVQTGSTPRYGIVGGGGTYAIRGQRCNVHYCYWTTVGYGQNPYVYGITGYTPTYGYALTGYSPTYANVQTGSYPEYTYEQTGTTPIYANVQTGSTPVYTYEQTGTTPIDGYTCPSGGQLDASGVTCVAGSSYEATYSTVSDTTVWHHGVNPNPNAFRTSGW